MRHTTIDATETMRKDEEEFIETMGRHFEEDGQPRIAGRLFGLLMVSEEPCSLDDLAEVLKVSKGSVSSNARLLEQWGLAERVTHPGDRRDYYQLAEDRHKRLLERQIVRLHGMLGHLRRAETSLATRSEGVRGRFRQAVELHEDALDMLQQVLERRQTR